jgi:hypothetical protein
MQALHIICCRMRHVNVSPDMLFCGLNTGDKVRRGGVSNCSGRPAAAATYPAAPSTQKRCKKRPPDQRRREKERRRQEVKKENRRAAHVAAI